MSEILLCAFIMFKNECHDFYNQLWSTCCCLKGDWGNFIKFAFLWNETECVSCAASVTANISCILNGIKKCRKMHATLWMVGEENVKETGRRLESGEQDSWVGPIVLSETDLCSFSWLAVSVCAHYRIMVGMAAWARAGQHLPVCQGQRAKPIEKQCDGHNGCDRLAASTGFLLLWPEINHKYPHWHPPTAHQASTTTHTPSHWHRQKRERK